MSILCLATPENKKRSKNMNTPPIEASFQYELPALRKTESGRSFIYINQDSYLCSGVECLDDITLYCDSATSCVIVVAIGEVSGEGEPAILMSHLSRKGRFDRFFEAVGYLFEKGVDIYAAGANPPIPCEKTDGTLDYTARDNAKYVMRWASLGKTNAAQFSMRFGQGNPAVYSNNLDCFGVETKDGVCRVSNERLYLTDTDRDPTGGVQTLFCIYGDAECIRDQNVPFSKSETDALVRAAKKAGKIERSVDMADEEILKTFSSTPDFEVPWFCSTIRQAGKYTRDYTF